MPEILPVDFQRNSAKALLKSARICKLLSIRNSLEFIALHCSYIDEFELLFTKTMTNQTVFLIVLINLINASNVRTDSLSNRPDLVPDLVRLEEVKELKFHHDLKTQGKHEALTFWFKISKN